MDNSIPMPPDRYNALGEWKPLVYPGNADELIVPISRLTDDEELQGTLLYIEVTGKQVAEFVVRTSLKLPNQPYSILPNAHLWACPLPTGITSANQNVVIYDGWIELADLSLEGIREAINKLRCSLHRLAFAFQASLTWRLKYLPSHHAKGLNEPSEDEAASLEWLFQSVPDNAEASLLDAAIDWYNTGSTSPNPLTQFLCYFIAMESLAIAVTDGEATFGLNVDPSSTQQMRAKRSDCIHALANDLLEAYPVSFATRAYFECVQSLSKRLRLILELVFGAGHPYIDLIFSRASSSSSLSEIRSKLAHGRITLLSPEDERLVRGNVFQMGLVAHEFIIRLCYSSSPADLNGPLGWSQRFSLEMSMSDPRAILILSDPRMLPIDDWRIRPEWCDS